MFLNCSKIAFKLFNNCIQTVQQLYSNFSTIAFKFSIVIINAFNSLNDKSSFKRHCLYLMRCYQCWSQEYNLIHEYWVFSANKCDPNPCINGAKCVNDERKVDGYKCLCTSDFTGKNCQGKASLFVVFCAEFWIATLIHFCLLDVASISVSIFVMLKYMSEYVAYWKTFDYGVQQKICTKRQKKLPDLPRSDDCYALVYWQSKELPKASQLRNWMTCPGGRGEACLFKHLESGKNLILLYNSPY